MKKGMSIGAVILAAGGSSRLGYPKQLLQLEGESLVFRASRMALEAGCRPVQVITGALHDPIHTALENLPVRVQQNPDWQEGQSTTVKLGLQLLAEREALVILLTDQVALRADWLNAFLDHFQQREEGILMAAYGKGRIGVPLALTRRHFHLAEKLHGDQGLKGLIRKEKIPHGTYPFPGGELDIDFESDLEKLKNKGFELTKKK